MASDDKSEGTYYSWTMFGTTTSFTRGAYWANYGVLIGVCVISTVIWAGFYLSTRAFPFLAVSFVFLLLAVFAYAVATLRIRSYQARKGKRT